MPPWARVVASPLRPRPARVSSLASLRSSPSDVLSLSGLPIWDCTTQFVDATLHRGRADASRRLFASARPVLLREVRAPGLPVVPRPAFGHPRASRSATLTWTSSMRPDLPRGQNVRISVESMSFAPNPVERQVWTIIPPGFVSSIRPERAPLKARKGARRARGDRHGRARDGRVVPGIEVHAVKLGGRGRQRHALLDRLRHVQSPPLWLLRGPARPVSSAPVRRRSRACRWPPRRARGNPDPADRRPAESRHREPRSRAGPRARRPPSSDSIRSTSARITPVTPLTSAAYVLGVTMPRRARAAGATIVRSAPVSRTSVTGPAPLICATTRIGAPATKGMVVVPARTAAGAPGGGDSTEDTAMGRAAAR